MSRTAALPPRLPDWPERLYAYIESRRRRPFAWGDNDCVTFAAGGVVAITGCRLSQVLPAAWGNVHEAARLVRDSGGLEQACSRALGPSIGGRAATLARRGSVVLTVLQGQQTLGLAAGGRFWCGPGSDGLVWRPMDEVNTAWEV